MFTVNHIKVTPSNLLKALAAEGFEDKDAVSVFKFLAESKKSFSKKELTKFLADAKKKKLWEGKKFFSELEKFIKSPKSQFTPAEKGWGVLSRDVVNAVLSDGDASEKDVALLLKLWQALEKEHSTAAKLAECDGKPVEVRNAIREDMEDAIGSLKYAKTGKPDAMRAIREQLQATAGGLAGQLWAVPEDIRRIFEREKIDTVEKLLKTSSTPAKLDRWTSDQGIYSDADLAAFHNILQQADLMRVATLNGENAYLLTQAGITSPAALGALGAAEVMSKLAALPAELKALHTLPKQSDVETWIAAAKLVKKGGIGGGAPSDGFAELPLKDRVGMMLDEMSPLVRKEVASKPEDYVKKLGLGESAYKKMSATVLKDIASWLDSQLGSGTPAAKAAVKKFLSGATVSEGLESSVSPRPEITLLKAGADKAGVIFKWDTSDGTEYQSWQLVHDTKANRFVALKYDTDCGTPKMTWLKKS